MVGISKEERLDPRYWMTTERQPLSRWAGSAGLSALIERISD